MALRTELEELEELRPLQSRLKTVADRRGKAVTMLEKNVEEVSQMRELLALQEAAACKGRATVGRVAKEVAELAGKVREEATTMRQRRNNQLNGRQDSKVACPKSCQRASHKVAATGSTPQR